MSYAMLCIVFLLEHPIKKGKLKIPIMELLNLNQMSIKIQT